MLMLFKQASLFAFVCFSFSPQSAFAEQNIGPKKAAAPWVEAVVAKVGPAVVKLGSSSGSRNRSGVIVTAEGHIVAFCPADRKTSANSEQVMVTFHDGQQATAKRLGWSGEWRVEILKISDKGPWPYVEIEPAVEATAGHPCLLVGYPRQDLVVDDEQALVDEAHRQIAELVTVEQSALPHWCTTSKVDAISKGVVFDQEGRFLGVTTNSQWMACTGVNILVKHWTDLIQGKNIDRVRMMGENKQEERLDATDQPEAAAVKAAAVSRAEAATVRITRFEDKKTWGSGVVVTSSGYVMTHAHGQFKRPNGKVTVTFADGKKSPGRIVNANLISDIALIKLAGDGPWPHVKWGKSINLRSGEVCIAVGYPHSHSGVEPLVQMTKVVEPTDIEWSHSLWTSMYLLEGGESGGGLFDQDGLLIGMIRGYRAWPKPKIAMHNRIEMLQAQYELLRDESTTTELQHQK